MLHAINDIPVSYKPDLAIWALKKDFAGKEISWRSAAEILSDAAGEEIVHTVLWDIAHKKYRANKKVRNALAKLGLYSFMQKDPRPRVWMRTDNARLAVNTLLKHYTAEEVLPLINAKHNRRATESVDKRQPGATARGGYPIH